MSATEKLVPIGAMLAILFANLLLGIPDAESWMITKLFFVLLAGAIVVVALVKLMDYQTRKVQMRRQAHQASSTPPPRTGSQYQHVPPRAAPQRTTRPKGQPAAQPQQKTEHQLVKDEYSELDALYRQFEQACKAVGVKVASSIMLTKSGIDALMSSATPPDINMLSPGLSSQKLASLREGINDLKKYVIRTTSKIEGITTRLENIADRLGALVGTHHEDDAIKLGQGLQSEGFMTLLDQEQWETANTLLDDIEALIDEKEQDLGQRTGGESARDELQEAYKIFNLTPPYERPKALKAYIRMVKKYNPDQAGILQQEQADRTKMMQKINPAKELIWQTHGWT